MEVAAFPELLRCAASGATRAGRAEALAAALDYVRAAPAALLLEAASSPHFERSLLPSSLQDEAEKCRERGASALVLLLERVPAAAPRVLANIHPLLRARLAGGDGQREPSEDVRLILAQLVRQLAAHCGARAAPLAELMPPLLRDGSPDVLVAACAATRALAQSSFSQLRSPSPMLLAEAATPCLSHSRAVVRLAALDTLEALIRCGADEQILVLSAWQDPNRIPIRAFYATEPQVQPNYLALLADDGNAAVRARFFSLAGSWALQHVDHTPRLLPYLLTGLADCMPEAAAAAARALDSLAISHEADAEEDLDDLAHPRPDWLGVAPRLGCRLAVQRSLSILLPASLRELHASADDVRLRAIQLIEALLRHAEEGMAPHVVTALPHIRGAAVGSDARVAPVALRCCRLVAFFTPRELWLSGTSGTVLAVMLEAAGAAE